ncbi:bifunctional helix-turn-helix transcriptional regulator/GNAT family N-acetyltransferase [Salinarimonas soli]|uniref:MarR family transcriptional regulator n=1 Tax=Salinarimonas soli TaxID=1638099 RepID=A0A5B2VEX5_9HYPH|nr:helix-turn-helix domain-containing GNAT family N-acetyltransferase [Salinarimonas soli]KAA2237395.1 MarR family transcriptional regulator [Salinarimonas soli]
MTETTLDRTQAVRRFTRFYTRRLGVLEEGLLGSDLTLVEARVLYELATREAPMAGAIAADLGLDAGYLSRILRRFVERGLLARTRSESDGRRRVLALTPLGRETFAPLDRRSREQVGALMSRLSDVDQHRLVSAMATIETLLGDGEAAGAAYGLRPHRPGDMGWIVHRHGALYAQEYGWDDTFEALVAEIAAGFVKSFDPKGDRCWIAEKDGEIVGSVLLVRQDATTAKLRLLYVEPKARGLGIGRRFVAEAVAFARGAGYRRITLWTNDILHAARRLYAEAGFRLVQEEPHHSFGQDLVGEVWELLLDPPSP